MSAFPLEADPSSCRGERRLRADSDRVREEPRDEGGGGIHGRHLGQAALQSTEPHTAEVDDVVATAELLRHQHFKQDVDPGRGDKDRVHQEVPRCSCSVQSEKALSSSSGRAFYQWVVGCSPLEGGWCFRGWRCGFQFRLVSGW